MKQLTLIAGPCVLEKKSTSYKIAEEVSQLCKRLGIDYIFKASFDKANRSSGNSFRGPGINEGLDILADLKETFGFKITTDIHDASQAYKVSKVVDIVQIPAFLCRQTDIVLSTVDAIKNSEKILNIKKGQFLAPWDMEQIVNKVKNAGIAPSSGKLWLTERGSSFGYNTLVVDFRSLPQLKQFECPVIFDATHSVQQPGGRGTSSGGQREYVAPLARAAAAVGIDGLFMEVHPDPEKALSDGPNMVPLHKLEAILKQIISIRKALGTNLASSQI